MPLRNNTTAGVQRLSFDVYKGCAEGGGYEAGVDDSRKLVRYNFEGVKVSALIWRVCFDVQLCVIRFYVTSDPKHPRKIRASIY
jgi:hypothetical protein